MRTSHFFERLAIEGGSLWTRGVVLPPSDNLQNATLPRLVLRTAPNSPVAARTVVRRANGTRFLAAFHAQERDYSTWIMFPVVQATWARPTVTVDPTTKLPKTSGTPRNLGAIWACIEPLGQPTQDPGLHMPVVKQLAITGADVKVADMINGSPVRRVYTSLGVTYAELD